MVSSNLGWVCFLFALIPLHTPTSIDSFYAALCGRGRALFHRERLRFPRLTAEMTHNLTADFVTLSHDETATNCSLIPDRTG